MTDVKTDVETGTGTGTETGIMTGAEKTAGKGFEPIFVGRDAEDVSCSPTSIDSPCDNLSIVTVLIHDEFLIKFRI